MPARNKELLAMMILVVIMAHVTAKQMLKVTSVILVLLVSTASLLAQVDATILFA